LVKETIIYPAYFLLKVCAHLSEHEKLMQLESTNFVHEFSYPDFSNVKAQSQSKRVLEIAVSGGHSVFMRSL